VSTFHRLLSRRWLLAFLGSAALLFGLAMLHPYPRQSLFGPTIRGKPWCVWEGAVRRHVHPDEADKILMVKTLRWLGVKHEDLKEKDLFDDPEMMPLVLHVMDDPDWKVQQTAIRAFIQYPALQNTLALPALYRRLRGNDAYVRVLAAEAIWGINQDKEVITVVVNLLQDEESKRHSHRYYAGLFLYTIHKEAPEILPHLAKLVRDENPEIRYFVASAMRHYGPKGVPVLIECLSDSHESMQRVAADSLGVLGLHAKDAIPFLERQTNSSHKGAREAAIEALLAIDPLRFRHWKAERKIE
jgi:HEAT repeat protein